MGENRLRLLCNAASILSRTHNKTYDILRSYYLMRCPEMRTSNKTPDNSVNRERCTYCCLDWLRSGTCQVKPVKLSRRQKKRMKSKKNSTILESKKLEKVCSLCGHVSTVKVVKLDKELNRKPTVADKNMIEKKPSNTKVQKPKKAPLNVYTNFKEVFSTRKENNIVKSDSVPCKINNKKRKNMFAGLCQRAVLEAKKKKQEDEKKNKLDLFLNQLV